MIVRNPVTGTRGSDFVDALPNDWDEAWKRAEQRAGSRGTGDGFVSPALLRRAYVFLFQAFASDCGAMKEIQTLTVTQVVEWYLDF